MNTYPSSKERWRRMVLGVASTILGVIALSTLAAVLYALPVVALWNWIVPEIFNGPKLTFGQGVGIYLLASLLLKEGVRVSPKGE